MVARNRVVLSGTLGSTANEIWQVGFHFAAPDGAVVEGTQALDSWAAGIATLLDAGETDYPILTALLSSSARLSGVACYEYGPTGPAVAVADAIYSWSGVGTVRCPWDTAVVFSLLTETAGRSFRGRAYWAALAATIGGNGQWNMSSGIAAEFAELLADIGGASPVPGVRAVIYSGTRNLVTPVTQIRVGDVPDNQRRRREGIPETFQTAPLP